MALAVFAHRFDAPQQGAAEQKADHDAKGDGHQCDACNDALVSRAQKFPAGDFTRNNYQIGLFRFLRRPEAHHLAPRFALLDANLPACRIKPWTFKPEIEKVALRR